MGTLSVVDMSPKILGPEQANALEVLGRQVSVRLEAMVQRKALAEAMAEKRQGRGQPAGERRVVSGVYECKSVS